MPQPAAAASKLSQTSLRAPDGCLGAVEQADSDSASQEADGACKHNEAPVVVNRQAGVDLEHCEPCLARGPNLILASTLPRSKAHLFDQKCTIIEFTAGTFLL